MQKIDSEEVVAAPTLQQGPPPRHLCVVVTEFDWESTPAYPNLFHEDYEVRNGDSDGKFRAAVGEALSKIVNP